MEDPPISPTEARAVDYRKGMAALDPNQGGVTHTLVTNTNKLTIQG